VNSPVLQRIPAQQAENDYAGDKRAQARETFFHENRLEAAK
jgi:hypothetical protein